MKNTAAGLSILLLLCTDLFAQSGSRMEGMNPSRTNASSAPAPVSRPTFEIIASNVAGRLERIASDGSLIMSDGAAVSSYEKTGRLRWRENISGVLNGAITDIAIAPIGTIYVSSAGTLTALNPDNGKPLWAQPLVVNSATASAPLVVDSQGTVYFHTGSTFGRPQQKLTAINPDGTRKWEYFAQSGQAPARPVFISDESTV